MYGYCCIDAGCLEAAYVRPCGALFALDESGLVLFKGGCQRASSV